jgi:hypothetical protein
MEHVERHHARMVCEFQLFAMLMPLQALFVHNRILTGTRTLILQCSTGGDIPSTVR